MREKHEVKEVTNEHPFVKREGCDFLLWTSRKLYESLFHKLLCFMK